jgi:hypothetical protein
MDVACDTLGKNRNAYKVLLGNKKKGDHIEGLDVGVWMILK